MSYTFKPYRGYHVQDVVVDGKSMGQLDSYTFSTVSENHTILCYGSEKRNIDQFQESGRELSGMLIAKKKN